MGWANGGSPLSRFQDSDWSLAEVSGRARWELACATGPGRRSFQVRGPYSVPSLQWRRLHYVANNMPFLILLGQRRPNLAAQVPAANRHRLLRDWQGTFGRPMVLEETFVDPDFAGTYYRAAGWRCRR